MKCKTTVLSALLVMGTASSALAAGYDTPMLYSARHMGMGGAAVGYVNDPSAMFHNPAGLAHTRKGAVLGNFSLLLGKLRGAPERGDENVTSNLTVAPFPLLAGAYRITDWLTAGLGIYPVASSGATYEYTNAASKQITDQTKLLFLEISPGVALNLPGNVHVGLGYRVTYLKLFRLRQANNEPADLDFSMSGSNPASFRVGAQWIPLDRLEPRADRKALQLGVSYRHKVEVDISADNGKVLTMDVTEMNSTFMLPTKMIAGVRGDYQRFGLALDVERTLNDQNTESVIEGTTGSNRIKVPNIFEWSNSWTCRTGLEYRLMDEGQLATRVGYVLDTKTASEGYPSAFGTPPSKTQVITAGAGYDAGSWQANLAYGFRFGGATLTREDTADSRNCPFCGKFGEYDIKLHGLYGDFSYEFD
jgi:long-subunit fatty acid transport protein